MRLRSLGVAQLRSETEDEGHRGSETRFQQLLAAGSQIGSTAGGGAAGAIIGGLVGGPAGALIGGAANAAVSMAITRLGGEISERMLSSREKARVGFVMGHAIAIMNERIESGDSLRSDGFFDAGDTDRSDADSVIEAVLLKSQREPQERKLPYMSRMFAAFALEDYYSPELAHQIVKAAEQLTYRQLCILRLAAVKNRYALRLSDYRGQETFATALYSVLFECVDLYNKSFLNFGGEVAFGPSDVKPGSMTVQGLGADIYNSMQLHEIPVEDVSPIAEVLT